MYSWGIWIPLLWYMLLISLVTLLTPDSLRCSSYSLNFKYSHLLKIVMPVSKGYWVYHRSWYLRKFLSECLVHAVTWGTTYNCISLEGKAFPAISTSCFQGKEFNPNKSIKFIFEKYPWNKGLYFHYFRHFYLWLVWWAWWWLQFLGLLCLWFPLASFSFFLRRYFLETSQDMKRLEPASEYQGSQVGRAVQPVFHSYCN